MSETWVLRIKLEMIYMSRYHPCVHPCVDLGKKIEIEYIFRV